MQSLRSKHTDFKMRLYILNHIVLLYIILQNITKSTNVEINYTDQSDNMCIVQSEPHSGNETCSRHSLNVQTHM